MNQVPNFKTTKTKTPSNFITALVAAVIAVFVALPLASALGFITRKASGNTNGQVLAATADPAASSAPASCAAPSSQSVKGGAGSAAAGSQFFTTHAINTSKSSSITNKKFANFTSVKNTTTTTVTNDNDLVDVDVLNNSNVLNNVLNKNSILNNNEVEVLNENLNGSQVGLVNLGSL
jgi:hypothetical protein